MISQDRVEHSTLPAQDDSQKNKYASEEQCTSEEAFPQIVNYKYVDSKDNFNDFQQNSPTMSEKEDLRAEF